MTQRLRYAWQPVTIVSCAIEAKMTMFTHLHQYWQQQQQRSTGACNNATRHWPISIPYWTRLNDKLATWDGYIADHTTVDVNGDWQLARIQYPIRGDSSEARCTLHARTVFSRVNCKLFVQRTTRRFSSVHPNQTWSVDYVTDDAIWPPQSIMRWEKSRSERRQKHIGKLLFLIKR